MCVRCGTGTIARCTDPYRHGDPPVPLFPATWTGGHALIIEFGDEELLARCQCGAHLGRGTPRTSLEEFSMPWEQHVMETRGAR